MSSEATDFIIGRLKRLSTEGSNPLPKKGESPLIINNSVTIASPSSSIPHHSQSVAGLHVGTPSFNESSESLIEEICRELDLQEQSIDDQLMQEAEEDVKMKRKWLSGRLEQGRKMADEKIQQEKEKRERGQT